MTNEATNAEKLLWSQVPVPQTNVSVYEALHGRRMAWKFKGTDVPREALDRMLATAIWAPNHRLTEPWRFFVMEKGTPPPPPPQADRGPGLRWPNGGLG